MSSPDDVDPASYIPPYEPINAPPPVPDPPKAADDTPKSHPRRFTMRGAPLANGQPTVFQPRDADAILYHLEKAGWSWSAENQRIKQLPPEHGPDIWINPSGKWVDIDDTSTPPRDRMLDLSELTDEQAELLEAEQAVVAAALDKRKTDRILAEGADPHVKDDTAQGGGFDA
ncbi:MAG: DUF2744 domain-containing protein [Rhodococcus sp. (in: high G+C Gram-positive bacteria)]